MNMSTALRIVEIELQLAELRHKPMNSPHEAKAVIEEELDELWEHVKDNTGRCTGAAHEATQVAAMGLRYLVNLIDQQTGDELLRRLEERRADAIAERV